MATLTYKEMHDWIRHNLGLLSQRVSTAEIEYSLAEITREAMIDLELEISEVFGDVTVTLADQYADLPVDCFAVIRVETVGGDGAETPINHTTFKDFATRKHFADNSIAHAYIVGRKLYLSWEVTEDTTVRLYYQTYMENNFIDTAEVNEEDEPEYNLGFNEKHMPVWMSRIMRYGVLADLVFVYAETEAHYFKAAKYEDKYLRLLALARKSGKTQLKAYQNMAPRNY